MCRLLCIALLVSSALPVSGAVVLRRVGSTVSVEIDGAPFTTFYFGPETPKPCLFPLRAAGGTVVTRGFPLEQIPGETTTDQHQRPAWLGFGLVNGFDFWQNEFSYHNSKAGKVVSTRIALLPNGFRGVFHWLSPDGQAMLQETRTMTFAGNQTLRTIDVDITLQALAETTFGDTKDGAFGIRLAEPLTEKNGGVITSSEGTRGMKETWGKRAAWVDYSGEINGEKLGVALFSHPKSFHHPARWHVRDYGLLAVNPFGEQAFDKSLPDGAYTLAKGKSLRLRYQIVIHGALDSQTLGSLYEAFAALP